MSKPEVNFSEEPGLNFFLEIFYDKSASANEKEESAQ